MNLIHSMQVNEISWNKQNDQFFLTNGNGCVVILRLAIEYAMWSVVGLPLV